MSTMSRCAVLNRVRDKREELESGDRGWISVVSPTTAARGDVEREDDEIWALVTSMWDRDDAPKEGQVRKLP